MFSEVVGYEVLFKNGITIRKASDVDIVANKFMRLSRNDLRDIEFLAKQEMNGPDVFAELIFKAIESKIIAKKENPRSKFADLHRLWVSKRND